MPVKVVKQVTAEIRGKSDQLDAEMAKAEQRIRRTKGEVEGLTKGTDAMAARYGGAARTVASATETIARSGKVTGDAAKQVLAAGSSIAFAFGPTGAIVGALGIFALAIGTAMRRARDELKQTREAFDDEIRRLRDGRDYKGAGDLLTRLLVGDPLSRKRELQLTFQALEEEVEALRTKLGNQPGVLQFNVLSDPTNPDTKVSADRQRLRVLEGALAERRAQILEAQQVFDFAAKLEQERLATEKKLAGDEEALKEYRAKIQKDFLEATRRTQQELEEFDRETRAFAQSFSRLALQEFGTAAEQVAAQFDELIAAGTRTVGENDPRVVQLRAWKDAAVEAAQAIANAQGTLRSLDLETATGGQPTAATLEDLSARAEELQSALGKLQKDSKEYLSVQAEILRVEQRRAAILKDIANAGGRSVGEATGATADLAREIQQAVDGALQLASAFEGVKRETIELLRSVAQIAGNLPALSGAIDNLRNKRDAGTASRSDQLGVLTAALPVAGALFSLGRTLFGESPEEAARREAIRKNTDAIRELTRKAGLLGLDVSGSQSSAAARAVDAVIRQSGLRPGGVGRLNLGGVSQLLSDSFGLTFAELERIAAQYGVTLDNTIESFYAMQEALRDTALKLGEFGTDLDSQRRQAAAELEIFGITDPLAALGIRTGAVKGRSPVFDQVLQGLDLGTAEGREQARKNAQALFEILKAGGTALTDEQLGGLNGQELLDAILELVQGLNDVDESLGVSTSTRLEADRIVTSDRTQITADQASRLLGLAASQLTELRAIREAIAGAGALRLPGPGVFLPTAPMSGPTVIQNVEFNGPVGDGPAVAQQIIDDLLEAIKRALGVEVVVARQNAGKAVLK